jgi:hypothetical protein
VFCLATLLVLCLALVAVAAAGCKGKDAAVFW